MFFVFIVQFTDGLHEGEEVHSAAAVNTWYNLEVRQRERGHKNLGIELAVSTFVTP